MAARRLAFALERGSWFGPALVVPAAALLGLLLAYPLGLGVWLGFQDAKIGEPGTFIGLENYQYLLDDPVFRLAAINTALYTVVTVVLKLALGLWLALVLNQRFAGVRFWRSVLLKLGVLDHNIDFLGNAWLARGSLMVANIWRGTPFFTIGYLAGLQSIPSDVYEAAQIDGARPWRVLWEITWPLLTPLTVILTTFSAIFTFTDFQLVWTITRGGPANATHLFVTLAYQRAIVGGSMSEGAAIAGVTLPALGLLAFAALRAIRERV